MCSGKGRSEVVSDVVRTRRDSPHTLGKIKDLIEATGEESTMLFLLDNYLSVRSSRRSNALPQSAPPTDNRADSDGRGSCRNNRKKNRRGLK